MKRLITLFTVMVMFAIGVQAQIVGANEGTKAKTSNTSSSLYKPIGHYLRLEAGYAHFFSVAYGYQINPYVMVGGGAGYGMGAWDDMLPIYAEALFSTPKYNWSFFGDLKVGFDMFYGFNFILAPRIGFSHKNFGVGLGIRYNIGYFDVTPDLSLYYNIPIKIHK